MNADEAVRALRLCGNDCEACPYYRCWIDCETGDPMDDCDEGRLFRDVLSVIESLQAQLTASQRRADAAVEDIYKMTDGGECDICKHYNPDKNTCAKPFVPYDDCFEWRGPQEAGEGERDG